MALSSLCHYFSEVPVEQVSAVAGIVICILVGICTLQVVRAFRRRRRRKREAARLAAKTPPPLPPVQRAAKSDKQEKPAKTEKQAQPAKAEKQAKPDVPPAEPKKEVGNSTVPIKKVKTKGK